MFQPTKWADFLFQICFLGRKNTDPDHVWLQWHFIQIWRLGNPNPKKRQQRHYGLLPGRKPGLERKQRNGCHILYLWCFGSPCQSEPERNRLLLCIQSPRRHHRDCQHQWKPFGHLSVWRLGKPKELFGLFGRNCFRAVCNTLFWRLIMIINKNNQHIIGVDSLSVNDLFLNSFEFIVKEKK